MPSWDSPSGCARRDGKHLGAAAAALRSMHCDHDNPDVWIGAWFPFKPGGYASALVAFNSPVD
jgi:hypothetical protein